VAQDLADTPGMTSPIPHNWQVPEVFRERMGSQAGRQRCMHHDRHLLVILHDIPDTETPHKREARLYWRGPDGTWQASSGGGTGIGPLRGHVELFIEAAGRLESIADRASSADEWFGLIQAASPMLRSARNMHRTLQEARELAKDDRALISVRDLAGDAERAFELIHAHAQEGLDYTIARRAEEQAQGAQHMLEAAHRLNMIAAVFLPVTAIATLLGMNLPHGLESAPAPHTFWLLVALSVGVGLWIKASMPRPAAAPEAPPPTRKKPRPADKQKSGGLKGR
jgi:hypothetical protein